MSEQDRRSVLAVLASALTAGCIGGGGVDVTPGSDTASASPTPSPTSTPSPTGTEPQQTPVPTETPTVEPTPTPGKSPTATGTPATTTQMLISPTRINPVPNVRVELQSTALYDQGSGLAVTTYLNDLRSERPDWQSDKPSRWVRAELWLFGADGSKLSYSSIAAQLDAGERERNDFGLPWPGRESVAASELRVSILEEAPNG